MRVEHIGDATLYLGDCLEILPTLPKVDAVVTDPPYGLGFMGAYWDHSVPSADLWRLVLAACKPGAHLLSFAGTRTQHRMAVNIEDAGFEIRDMIAWVYGSGFPKSLNLKGEWKGWGTALKPSMEPITVARKPLVGTVAENVLAHGTGAINVDGCRVAADWDNDPSKRGFGYGVMKQGERQKYADRASGEWGMKDETQWTPTQGRWPANLIHDGSDEVVGLFPSPHGAGKARDASEGTHRGFHDGVTNFSGAPAMRFGDSGSAARFFYCAKASKADRDEGCEGLEAIHRANGNKWTDQDYRVTNGERPPSAESGPRRNHHPTVKPTDLMRYLIRLVTPPGGVVLDPFMGSGSTGKAAALEGFRFIGVEIEPKYFDIACRRIEQAYAQGKLFDPKPIQDDYEQVTMFEADK